MAKYKQNKYKGIITPVIVIVVVFVVAFFGGSELVGRISAMQTDISALEKLQTTLENRLSTLQVYDSQLLDESNVASVALPSGNPSVLVVAQLRSLAKDNSIAIGNLRLDSIEDLATETQTQLKKVNIGFELTGEGDRVLEFIDALAKISPLVNLESINVVMRSGIGLNGEIRLSAFYAPFPDKLPALDEPVSDLSQADESTLDFISNLRSPALPSASQSATVPVRDTTNPFQTDI